MQKFLPIVGYVTPQKFLERVRPTGDCEKPNIELVLKTTLSNTENHIVQFVIQYQLAFSTSSTDSLNSKSVTVL